MQLTPFPRTKQLGEPQLSKWTHEGADMGVSDKEYSTWFASPQTIPE